MLSGAFAASRSATAFGSNSFFQGHLRQQHEHHDCRLSAQVDAFAHGFGRFARRQPLNASCFANANAVDDQQPHIAGPF